MSERKITSARVTVPGSSRDDARVRAREAFKDFFGDENYEITNESAEASHVTVFGEVLAWDCTFEAVSPA